MKITVGSGLTDPDHECPDWAQQYSVDAYGVPNSLEDGGLPAWARHQTEYHSVLEEPDDDETGEPEC